MTLVTSVFSSTIATLENLLLSGDHCFFVPSLCNRLRCDSSYDCNDNQRSFAHRKYFYDLKTKKIKVIKEK